MSPRRILRGLDALAGLLFGPDAEMAPDIKNGAAAEAGRREVETMESIAHLDAVPTTVDAADETISFSPGRLRAERWIIEMLREARNGPVTRVITLTPDIARALLARNPNNRKLSPVTVEKYARDIATGRWDFNGTTIVVSLGGEMNDGQHRCEAVVAAGRSISVVIVFGPDRASRMTLDRNRVRTVGDYLGMQGHADSVSKAAVATYVYQYRQRNRLSQQHHARPTKSESLSIVESHPELDASIAAVGGKGCNAVGGRSLLAFCHWVLAKRAGQEAATAFIRSLVDGAGLDARNPILYARNRLSDQRGRMTANEKAELIFRAWNAHRLGRRPATLVVNNGELPAVEG